MRALSKADRAVRRVHATDGVLPKTLPREAMLDDGWGHPLVYTRSSPDRYALRSLGRDGRPGGRGLDTDATPAMSIPDYRALAPLRWFQRVNSETLLLAAWLALGVTGSAYLGRRAWQRPVDARRSLLLRRDAWAFALILVLAWTGVAWLLGLGYLMQDFGVGMDD